MKKSAISAPLSIKKASSVSKTSVSFPSSTTNRITTNLGTDNHSTAQTNKVLHRTNIVLHRQT